MWVPELAYQKVLKSLGISRSTEEIAKALARAEKDSETQGLRSVYGKVSYREYWHRWNSIVLDHLAISITEKLLAEIQARWFDCAESELYPDVKKVLLELRKMKLKTGLISTAYEEDIDAIFEKVGLHRELFHIVIGANTIKKEKPHPDVFKYALEKLKVKPEQAIFVGDHIDADYKGAQKVGIRPLLMRRTVTPEASNASLQTIGSLAEILQYINEDYRHKPTKTAKPKSS